MAELVSPPTRRVSEVALWEVLLLKITMVIILAEHREELGEEGVVMGLEAQMAVTATPQVLPEEEVPDLTKAVVKQEAMLVAEARREPVELQVAEVAAPEIGLQIVDRLEVEADLKLTQEAT